MVVSKRLQIGVLALQGDVAPHCSILERLNVAPLRVTSPDQIAEIDGLVLPGGESTTIGLLLSKSGLKAAIHDRHRQYGLPLFGTCAGMILLAKRIVETPDQPHLDLLDITVQRNAFGRQRESCEALVDAPTFGPSPLRALFIRAPIVVAASPRVDVLARWKDRIVLVRDGTLLASAFHPELADDDRLHRYFLEIVQANRTAHVRASG